MGSPIVLDDEVALDFAALFSVETAFLRADSWSDKLQWSMSDTVRQHCSHHGKAPTRFECIRNAHEFPPVTIASWAWIKAGFIEEWMKPRPVDKMKIIEHCRRAERAVLCLQQHDVHVRWLDIEPQFPNNKFGWLSTFSFPNGPYVAPSLGNISGEGSLEWTDLAHRQLWNRQMPDEIACHWGDGSYYLCRAAEQQAYSSQSVVPGSRTVATTDWSRAASTHSLPPPVAHSASWPTPYRHAASKSDLGARAATSPAIVGGAESIDLPLIPKHLAKDSNHSKNDPDASTISAESYDPRPDAQLRREVGSFTVWYKELRLDKVALVFFCAAYGGAHTAAWSHPFPTTVEMWLWRGVCLFMLNIPISMLLVVFLKTLEVSLVLWGHWERMQRTLKWLYTNCAIVAMCTLGMYHFARMFLLAEALAALRKPVPGTYDDVNWSKYVPHIN